MRRHLSNRVWRAVQRGFEPGSRAREAVEAVWAIRFEILAAMLAELAWMIVRLMIKWLFGTVVAPRPRGKVVRLVPRPA